MPRVRQILALVLKRSNSGEADRVVTLYSPEEGKIACMARGVRKMHSKKRSSLEPGTLVKISLSEGKGMPFIAQAVPMNEFTLLKSSFAGTKKLFQLLEMIDVLAKEPDARAFQSFLEILLLLELDPGVKHAEISHRLNALLQYLGYQDVQETSFSSITEYVEFLVEKKLKAWEYLHNQVT